MTRPDVAAMSVEFLLDEHRDSYLEDAERHDAIRAEILRRFEVQREQIAALQRIIAEDQTPAGIEVERLTKGRDEAVAKMGRYRNDVERLRAILQEDDQRAWVAMGRPENTRTTNAVRICEELTAARAEVERLRAALRGLYDANMSLLRLLYSRIDHDDGASLRLVGQTESGARYEILLVDRPASSAQWLARRLADYCARQIINERKTHGMIVDSLANSARIVKEASDGQ